MRIFLCTPISLSRAEWITSWWDSDCLCYLSSILTRTSSTPLYLLYLHMYLLQSTKLHCKNEFFSKTTLEELQCGFTLVYHQCSTLLSQDTKRCKNMSSWCKPMRTLQPIFSKQCCGNSIIKKRIDFIYQHWEKKLVRGRTWPRPCWLVATIFQSSVIWNESSVLVDLRERCSVSRCEAWLGCRNRYRTVNLLCMDVVVVPVGLSLDWFLPILAFRHVVMASCLAGGLLTFVIRAYVGLFVGFGGLLVSWRDQCGSRIWSEEFCGISSVWSLMIEELGIAVSRSSLQFVFASDDVDRPSLLFLWPRRWRSRWWENSWIDISAKERTLNCTGSWS